jgi:acetyl-CoA carboxylase, biotin carboxylase subunit
LHKILVANRGEIAVRVLRACRDMGIASVAVYSDCDRTARHVRMADEAVAIGPSPPADSYLRIDRLIDAARSTGADAVHPGYGFLAENAEFASACLDAGLTFIGPTPDAIRLMGSKTAARRAAMAAGVDVVPGTHDPLGTAVRAEDLAHTAAGIGYPLVVKAVAGGGGKGMRVVETPADLDSAVRAARSEAAAAFGEASIYIERRLARPRHIEIQLLADRCGTVLPFVERECSIQRRHQKVIEESPSPVVSPALRDRLMRAAAAVAASVGYTNAGTVEFLLDEDDRFYFLEMNTRLQVEHPVTEMVTGIDLVRWQMRIAQGERLTLAAEQLSVPRGHAIECRIYAEDADAGFMPSPGRVTAVRVPDGPGIRNDSGIEAGAEVPIHYDPLISKLIAWGEDRRQSIDRMRRALQEYQVHGVRTSVSFFQWMMRQSAFVEAAFHTEYLDELLQRRHGEPFSIVDPPLQRVAVIAAAVYAAVRHEPLRRVLGSHSPAGGGHRVDGGWKMRGRVEGLRE